VELSILEGTDDEVYTWIRSGVAHIGFAALPVDGVESEEIARDEWLALLPEKALSGETSITLRELARHKFLMSGGGCERHILRVLASEGIAIAEPMMVKQMPTIHAVVARRARGQPDSPTVLRWRPGLSNAAIEATSLPAYRNDSIY
jgi:DNA-binding transcriptional LysR family regulator